MYPKFTAEQIKENGHAFHVFFLEVENAVFVFFGEEPKLGTFSVALPPRGEGPTTSSVLLGDRNTIVTRILAERLATAFGKMVLVSTYLKKISEGEGGPVLLKLAQKLLEKEIK
ncbi:hypothetical protein KEJ26_05930 [Candidatus Bathyarchaeota archaeon]|nr:hypothetical protein [Candidatus Bathyarchaeota archaeon]